MKAALKACAVLLVLGVTLAAQPAAAGGPWRGHHSHWRSSIGISIGVPIGGFGYFGYYPHFYSPFYYPPYYPAPVIVQQQPVYVERDPLPAPSAQPQAPAGYWYYCIASGAYYPYVKECPGGWQRVAPQPG